MRNSYLIVFVFFISALSYGQYCTPINTSCFSDNRIGVVKSYNAVEDLNYTFSGSCTSNGYRNETSDTLAVRPGDQIHLVLTGMDGFVDPAFYIVFVDWNLAGNFTAQMEVWNSSTVLVSGAAVMASFTVPIGAAIGNTRMRIKKLSNTNVSPCSGGGNQGEIIDFSVRVQTVGACIAPPIILSVAASNELTCLGKSVLLFPTFQQTGPGMQYQWQSSSDQTAWGNISGSNTPAVAVSPISTLFYRLIASCGASTDTSLSLLVSPITALADAITVNPTVPISASNVHTNRQLSFLLQCAPVTLPTVVNYINPSSPLPDFLKLVDIAGLSATNTLIINGNGAELVPERTTFEHGVIHFDNVQFVTLNDFSVHIPASLGGNSVKCIQLTNNASDNTIQNCTLEMPINNTQFLYGIAGFNGNQSPITDGTPNPCERLTVANTIIKGGRYGALLRASNVNTPMSGIVFQNNQILDFQEFGIRFQFTNGTQILQNEFSRATRTTNLLSAGAFCVSAIENTSYRIDDNYFHNLIFPTNTSFSTSAVAISSINNPGTPTAVSVISNNLILAENLFRGNVSGVSLQGTDRYVKCVHNTIQLEAAPTTTNFMTFNGVVTIGGFSSQNFMGCAISNNIFGGRLASASQSFFALNFAQGAFSVIPTDNNVFYDVNPGVGNYFIGVFGLNRQYATLGSWQQGEGLDSNSRFDDPNYLGGASQDSAFLPQNGAIHSMGANFNAFAPLDRLGVARPANPAPGAYQFSVPHGVAPDLVNSPTLDSILCQGTPPLLLVIDNLGSDTMTSVTLVRRLNGLPIDTIVIAQPFPPKTPQTVSTGPFSFVVNAFYNIEFEVIESAPTPPLSFGNQTLGYPATRVGMEGSYTMNPAVPATTTNYQSITAFVSALQTRGLCGHVTLNFAPNLSPLDEQVTFVDIETNASKTITINGSGNVLFSSALSNQQRSVVRIIGVDFITIDSLSIEATSNLRYAVHIDDNASNITLRNSHLIGIQGNQRGEAGVSVAGSLFSGAHIPNASASKEITLENNIFEGFARSLVLDGNQTTSQTTGYIKKVNIIGNMFLDFNEHAIFTRTIDSVIIQNNTFERQLIPSSVGVVGCVWFTQVALTKLDISKNTFKSLLPASAPSSPSTLFGVRFSIPISGFNPTASSNVVYNNIFYGTETGATVVPFLSEAAVHDLYIVHNTIYYQRNRVPLNFNTPTFYALLTRNYNLTGNQLTFKNNLIYAEGISNGTLAIYNALDENTFVANNHIDYNGVFLSNTPVANGHYALINGQAYSYAQLQSSTFAFDGNNALANPDFVDVATADFTPTSAAHSQIGTDMLVRVAEDFFGVARTATPDPGAIEFVPLRCQGIVNFDIDSSDVDAVHLSWSSSESSFEFWYGLQGTTPGDPNGATTLLMQKDFSLLNLPLNVCLDLYVRELCDSTSSSWAGPLLFCTPANIDVALSQLVTPADEACGQSNQLISAWVVNLGIQPVNEIPLTLDVTGNVTQLINYTWFGNLPAGDSVQVTFGTVNTQRGGVLNFKLWSTVANDGNANNDTISTALLLFPDSIEVTQRHWCDSGDPAFFDAPPIPGVEYAWYESISQVTPSFVGNSFAAGNQQPGFTVYVDYNNSNCLNNRQPITLMATGAPQSDFTHAENQLAVTFYFQGANADSLFWTFGNGLGTGLGDSVTFVFPYAWTFPVCVYAFNRCGVDTLCKSVAVTGAVSTEFFEQNSFRWELFPNPTKDIVTLQFDGLLYNEFFVQLTNAAGQQVLEIHNTCNGVCNTQFDVSGLSAGVYFIAVAVKDAVWRHRLIIAK